LLLLLVVCGFSSCASVQVGFQSDGSYLLEQNEINANCNALYKSIWGRIQLLKGLPGKAQAEQATAPPTASSFFGRLFGGPNKGLSAVAEYTRERAHVTSLQRTMVEKKCVDVDVTGELAQADAEIDRLRQN
jgi:hypothetical protein